MKRLIAYIIALALFVMAFAGCSAPADNTDEPNPTAEVAQPTAEPTAEPEPEVNPIENAIAYIKQMYRNDAVKTAADYQVVGFAVVNGTSYQIDWSIEITSGAEDAVVVSELGEDKMVTIDINESCAEESEYTLTATISDGTDSASESFSHIVPKGFDLGTASYDEIVAAGYELEDGAALEGTLRLFGTIVSIDTPYSADYNNITVTIAVKGLEEYPIQCYRLCGEGADTLAVGEEITVEGSIKNYKGTIEFDAGCALIGRGEFPAHAKLLENAYALEAGAAMVNATAMSGVITSIDTAYSADYNNITVTMVCDGIEDMPIQCYRLSGEGAEALAVGDEIAVYGTIKNYNGTIEFDAGCKLIDKEAVSSARVVAKAYTLEESAAMQGTKTLTGTISSIDTAYSADYDNITVTIIVGGLTDYPVQCYRLTGEGAAELAEGDVITVTGAIKNYKGTIEFDAGCTFTK